MSTVHVQGHTTPTSQPLPYKHNSPEEVAEQVGKLMVDVGFGYLQVGVVRSSLYGSNEERAVYTPHVPTHSQHHHPSPYIYTHPHPTLQSAALGYAFGAGGHLMADERTKKAYATRFGSKAAHLKGLKQAKQFGEFCAAFTAFEGLVHVARGVGDKWNGIVGSTMVGVYAVRKKSWAARLQNGVTFGGFNYLLSSFAGGEGEEVGGKGAGKGKGKGQGGKEREKERGKAPVGGGKGRR